MLKLKNSFVLLSDLISSTARGGGGGAGELQPPPIGMSTKMQNEKKHYVFSTFETVKCTRVD